MAARQGMMVVMNMTEHETVPPSRYVAAVSRHIKAPAGQLFDIVASPAMHPVLDGQRTVQRGRPGNPERLSAGATFSMGMRLGVPYRTVSHVVEFEEGRLIAWRVGGRGAIWRYRFDPEGDGTRVTEQWDVSAMPTRLLLLAAGFARRSRIGMLLTLKHLAEHVAA